MNVFFETDKGALMKKVLRRVNTENRGGVFPTLPYSNLPSDTAVMARQTNRGQVLGPPVLGSATEAGWPATTEPSDGPVDHWVFDRHDRMGPRGHLAEVVNQLAFCCVDVLMC